jgi:hypothetical protein
MDAIGRALAPDAELQRAIAAYGPAVTPWRDGRSAGRIMAAVEEMLAGGWQDKKPLNLLRNLRDAPPARLLPVLTRLREPPCIHCRPSSYA